MDNGEELSMLNEPWTFMGVRLNEWIIGFMTMILILGITGAKGPGIMPIVIGAGVFCSYGAAILRSRFPDEERGLRNFAMLKLGFAPTGIPTPSELQPYWSGAPIRKLKDTTRYQELGLDDLFEKDLNEDQGR
jgi:hypothetical protein